MKNNIFNKKKIKEMIKNMKIKENQKRKIF
jgi:hypothetical protein